MTDVFKRLAKRLDELPNGFPETDIGVELKILKKIFTPEDAEMALQLKPVPETVETIAARTGKSVSEMQGILDNMVGKGQIGSVKQSGEQVYMLFPFIVGIYEFQVNRIDRELAELVDQYIPYLGTTMADHSPGLLRVVPVDTQIQAAHQVHRYEEMHRKINEAKSFQLLDCICRKHQALEGKPCDHTLATCLGFSAEEGAYDRYSHGKIISKEEALEVIEQCEKEGLVHCTYNVEGGIGTHVCNCCKCCCGLFQGVKMLGHAPGLLVNSNYIAAIDQDTCEACGVCAEDRCPMDAIKEENNTYSVLDERCIGCGVCTTTCPTESITLVRKPEADHGVPPPKDITEWNVQRAANRGVEFNIE